MKCALCDFGNLPICPDIYNIMCGECAAGMLNLMHRDSFTANGDQWSASDFKGGYTYYPNSSAGDMVKKLRANPNFCLQCREVHQ
jgi:hypothetical protein